MRANFHNTPTMDSYGSSQPASKKYPKLGLSLRSSKVKIGSIGAIDGAPLRAGQPVMLASSWLTA